MPRIRLGFQLLQKITERGEKIENKYEGWKTVARINKEEYQLLKELGK